RDAPGEARGPARRAALPERDRDVHAERAPRTRTAERELAPALGDRARDCSFLDGEQRRLRPFDRELGERRAGWKQRCDHAGAYGWSFWRTDRPVARRTRFFADVKPASTKCQARSRPSDAPTGVGSMPSRRSAALPR